MKYQKGTFNVVPNKKHLLGKPSEMQCVYFWIVDHADEYGKCFPNRSTLARESGCNIKTVDKYIKKLIEDGFIIKTNRKNQESSANMSNLYQLLVIEETPETEYPHTESGFNPTTNTGSVTIPSINNTQITVVTEQKEEKKKQDTYITRLLRRYSFLFGKIYGFAPTVNIGRFGKTMKELMESRSEKQISALMIIYFQWHGMTGNDNYEYEKLTKSTHNPQWFGSTINQYEAYMRNVLHINMDDELELDTFIKNNYK